MKFAILAVGMVLVVGCGGPNATQESASGSTLRLVMGNSPETIDPILSQQVETNDLLAHVYETLVTFNESNEIVGLLAESWTISPDGKTVEFTLRKGVKFHDGSPFTAEDVKASWERLADPKSASPLVMNYLGDIRGVRERVDGKAASISGLEVAAPDRLVAKLTAARPSFLGKLSYTATAILPKAQVPAGQILSDPSMAVGTGPFKLTAFNPQQEVSLSANSDYHGGKPMVERISFRIAKDAATRVGLFRAGQLDVLALPSQDVEGFRADPKTKDLIGLYDAPSVNYVGMNGSVYPPFKDVRVRRAFVMAVDRGRIVETLLKGVGKPADGILPPVIPQVDAPKDLPQFDPVAAKKLIAEAGFTKLPPIELWVNDSSQDRKRIAEFVVGQLAENLGVDAKLRLAESAIVIQKATKKELPFFYGNWSADYLDAENFLSLLLSNYGQDRTNWNNVPFSDLTRKADSELDETKRKELYGKAERLALQECPWIPLYFPQDAVVVREGVTGLRRNAFGFMPHTQVKLSR